MCFRPPFSVIVSVLSDFHALGPLSIIRIEPTGNAVF
jgi:hypothetical protein